MSQAFIDIMNSQIRPKCEPKITVKGHSYNSNVVYSCYIGDEINAYPEQENGTTAGDLVKPVKRFYAKYVGNKKIGLKYCVKALNWGSYTDNWTSYSAFQLKNIKIKLTGDDSFQFSIRYRACDDSLNWSDWASDDEELTADIDIVGIQVELLRTESYLIDENVDIVWEAKDIQELHFSRYIDPLGRTLPTMELQWTELYYGKFNEYNFPEKYQNVGKYLPVSCEFLQYLNFYPTWKTVKSQLWSLIKNKTWKQVKNEVDCESTKLPMMFLKASPEIDGHKIKWTAVDALSLLNDTQTKRFTPVTAGVTISNVFQNILIDSRSQFGLCKELFDYLTLSINSFNSQTGIIGDRIIDGVVKDQLMQLLSQYNLYLDFDDEKIAVKNANDIFTANVNGEMKLNLMVNPPIVTLGKNISTYNYKAYKWEPKPENNYQLLPSSIIQYGNNYLKTYFYDGYGEIANLNGIGDISKAYVISPSDTADEITVTPIVEIVTDYIVQTGKKGETYEENTKHHIYEASIDDRLTLLNRYFREDKRSLEVTGLPRFDFIVGELADYETMLYNNDNTTKVVRCALVGMNIDYTSGIRQKFYLHEV